MTRAATFNRETTETQITGALTIDGRGRYDVRTGIRFFDHMLELFTRHGGFDLTLKATGDLDVDQHHTVELAYQAGADLERQPCLADPTYAYQGHQTRIRADQQVPEN